VTPPPDLPGFLGAIAPLLDHWGYLAVGSLVLLEDFGVPVPGETVLIAAAVYAGAGRLEIASVIVIGFLAAIVGDSIGFTIGRFGGRRLVLRYGKYVFITPKRLDAAERFFTRHGGKIVTIARFVEGLRQANGIIAGMTGMRWRRFVAFNVLGALLWVGVWTSLGYLAGANLTAIWNAIGRYQPYFYSAIGLLVVGLVVWHLRRRRRERPPDEPPEPPVADRVAEDVA
jgi:membrane protein DedA with SNARE-associated domain